MALDFIPLPWTYFFSLFSKLEHLIISFVHHHDRHLLHHLFEFFSKVSENRKAILFPFEQKLLSWGRRPPFPGLRRFPLKKTLFFFVSLMIWPHVSVRASNCKAWARCYLAATVSPSSFPPAAMRAVGWNGFDFRPVTPLDLCRTPGVQDGRAWKSPTRQTGS